MKISLDDLKKLRQETSAVDAELRPRFEEECANLEKTKKILHMSGCE